MTDFIYSRVSTLGQSTDPQLLPLVQRFPEARVVSEVVSGIKARPLLNALVRELKKNDRLIVYSLDRLGRRLRSRDARRTWVSPSAASSRPEPG